MIVSLSHSYVPRTGVPVVDRVDTRLFTATFFSDCMRCDFCHDSCCQYGATVEVPLMESLLARREVLEPIVGHDAEDHVAELLGRQLRGIRIVCGIGPVHPERDAKLLGEQAGDLVVQPGG